MVQLGSRVVLHAIFSIFWVQVYRGSMMGLPVAVKKLDETGLQGREQFFREVEVSVWGRKGYRCSVALATPTTNTS